MNEPLRSDQGPQCEVLFELFAAAHGTAHVGRMLKGVETGRLVLLRQPKLGLSRAARSAVDVARSVAHPAFNKLLGVVRGAQHEYLASEYVPGASLSEVSSVIRQRGEPLAAPVAVRLILDALKAASIASDLLADTAGVTKVRFVFADTVWVAEYGDVLLMELGVAALLGEGEEESAEVAASKDVYSAALELLQLACAERVSAANLQELQRLVPAELGDVLRAAFGIGGARAIVTPLELSRALADLPAELIASDREVEQDLQRVMGKAFEARRSKLELLTIGAASQYDEETTQFFSASALAETSLETARPPAPEGAPPPVRIEPVRPANGRDESALPPAPEVALAPVHFEPAHDEAALQRLTTESSVPPAPRHAWLSNRHMGICALVLVLLALLLIVRPGWLVAALR